MLDETYESDDELDLDIPDGLINDEPISAQEIDRVVNSISMLIESTSNSVIREILENACCELSELAELSDDDELEEAA